MFSSFSSLASRGPSKDATSQQEPSLTTILSTPAAREDLTLLLATITETMRQSIDTTFSAGIDPQVDPFVPSYARADRTNTSGGPKTDDDRAWIDFVKNDIASQEKIKEETERRKRELGTDKIRAMKKSCLAQYDEWRQKVLSRVGEVVNERKEESADEQGNKAQKDGQAPLSSSSEKQITQVQDPRAVREALNRAYPPTETSLRGLAQDKKALILHSMLLLLLSLEAYTAWSRVLLLHLTSSLGLAVKLLEEDEAKIATGLLKAVDMSGDSSTKKAAEDNASSRKWKVGLATVAGAAVIGLTGGLAAPLIAAGVGSVMGGIGLGATATAGYLGTLAGSSVLVGGLFGAYGGKMTGRMMDQYAKEVEDFAFVPRHKPKPGATAEDHRRLRVTVGVSGWLTSADDVVRPWNVFGTDGAEIFALRFELKALMGLGNALSSLLRSAAWSYAKMEIIKRTVFASITAALWPISIARLVDSPWSIAKNRADKAGEVLADAIMDKAQGERPVSLYGYSLGARVVYICLKKLADRGAFGLVEDVVLMGAPTPSDELDWRIVRAVAVGRVINAYSTQDYVLGFLYRSSSVQLGVAGLQKIDGVTGVENIDLSPDIEGHTGWRFAVGLVLQRVGISDVLDDRVQMQVALGKQEKRDEEDKRKEAEKSDDGKLAAAAKEEEAAPRGTLVADDEAKVVEKTGARKE